MKSVAGRLAPAGRVVEYTGESTGSSLASEADEETSGPASFIAIDPDRNPVLVDQHV